MHCLSGKFLHFTLLSLLWPVASTSIFTYFNETVVLGRVEEEIHTNILKLSDCHFLVKCEPQQGSLFCRCGNWPRKFSNRIRSAGLCCRDLPPAAVHQVGFHPHSETSLVPTPPQGEAKCQKLQDGEPFGLLAVIPCEFVEGAGLERTSLAG